MRIQGRDQVAFAKGASLGCRAVPHTVVAVGAGGALSRPGCGPAESEGASLRRGVSDRGPQMSLSLLGGGGDSGPAHISAAAEQSGKVGGFSAARSRRPVGSNLGRLARTPRARPSAPEVERSLLPALFIFQHAQPVAARRSVSLSVPARVRAPPHSMAAPRGPHSQAPAPPPSARRTPRGAQGKWGRGARASGLGGAERGGEGARARSTRGGGRGSARRRVRSRFRAERGASGGAELEPPGAGPRWPCTGEGRGRECAARGAAAGAAPGVASAPGPGSATDALRSGRRASAAAAPPPPPRRFLPLGGRFFFFFPFLLCQGSQETRGEASPRTFKGAVVTRGAARGSRD